MDLPTVLQALSRGMYFAYIFLPLLELFTIFQAKEVLQHAHSCPSLGMHVLNRAGAQPCQAASLAHQHRCT
jgi:hypothetical protein